MTNDEKTELCYEFFKSNNGKVISLRDISKATGWAESTVKTYKAKKWKDILEKQSGNSYKTCFKETLEEFKERQSQVRNL
ncbi:MAG: hypothetical protein OIF32_07965 [Campylobacterales bacterium]|nr:hypothetical protein [Campylobacterales bacterium]